MGEFFDLYEAGILNSMGEYDPGNTEFYGGQRGKNYKKFKPNPLFGLDKWLKGRLEKTETRKVLLEFIVSDKNDSHVMFNADAKDEDIAAVVSIQFSNFTKWYNQVYRKSKK